MLTRPTTSTINSDDSTATFASTSTSEDSLRHSSTDSLYHPYSNLSAQIVRTDSTDSSREIGQQQFSSGFDPLSDYAFPRPGTSRTVSDEEDKNPLDINKSLKSLREGKEEDFLPSPNSTAGRHNSLPLFHSTHSTRPQHDARSQSVLDPSLFTNPRDSPLPPGSPPASIARSYSFGPPSSPSQSSTRSPSLPRPNSFTQSMGLSGSSRPNSSGTFSTASSNASTSTRPWVRDCDASSICSTGSGSYWSDQMTDAEVLKVGADGIEFLDPRPEPPGARLTIDRDDPFQVVLKVVLPGFSLDNITVAMRRGHKVHIVADSYGENGGHFEKLISLGSDVVSAAPRAEFNGTELSVFVQRRQPSIPVPPTSLNVASPSDSSPSSSTQSLSPHSPSTASSISSEEAPIVTRSTATGKHKVLTGPEGAKAAAKLAREEASSRAKEAAKDLPKLRKLPFALERQRSKSQDEYPRSATETKPPSLSIKIPAVTDEEQGTPTISPSFSTTSTSTAIQEHASLPLPRTIASNNTPPVHSSSKSLSTPVSLSPRPKLRTSNLTLRPSSSTFFEASLSSRGEEWTGQARSEGSVTPRVELDEMGFEPFVVNEISESVGTAL